ncbi:MAG: transposase [Rubellimicrobium sp.]|nr:transposase [Rubellimicrobium sp.]
MSSTKKDNDWYFGSEEDQKSIRGIDFPTNAHIGVDVDSGVAHSLETSTDRLQDSQVWDELLHGEETSVWADKSYVSAGREAAFRGRGKVGGVMRKAPKGGQLHPLDARINRIIAMVRAKVEHPFRVIERQFGHVKTRYRGLTKNCAQLFTLFALDNQIRTPARRRLAPRGLSAPRQHGQPFRADRPCVRASCRSRRDLGDVAGGGDRDQVGRAHRAVFRIE